MKPNPETPSEMRDVIRDERSKIRAEELQLSVDILTDEQCAAILSVLPRTLRLWRKTRGLPYIKLTTKVIRYRRSDINTWLASNSKVEEVAK